MGHEIIRFDKNSREQDGWYILILSKMPRFPLKREFRKVAISFWMRNDY